MAETAWNPIATVPVKTHVLLRVPKLIRGYGAGSRVYTLMVGYQAQQHADPTFWTVPGQWRVYPDGWLPLPSAEAQGS